MTSSRLGWALLAAMLIASPLHAQPFGGVIQVRDSSTGAVIPNVGDDANDAIRVNVVAGGAGGGGTSSSFGAAFPSSGTANGFSDGTNMQGARVFDMDSGGGSQYVLGVGVRGTASGGSVDIPGTVANGLLVDVSRVQGTVSSTQSGTWTMQPGNTANTTPWLVKHVRAASSTLANVAGSASSVTCLASNANRLGAIVYNDSTSHVFVKFGATASATSYSHRVEGGGTLEVPFHYTGVIDCIWGTATGNARVTELAQ